MDEKKNSDFGPIEVNMGDGNVVGDIGHKITFHAPPPSPNAIFQDDRVVGEIASDPVSYPDGTITFREIYASAGFDESRPFKLQGINLEIVGLDTIAEAQFAGGPMRESLHRVRCRQVQS